MTTPELPDAHAAQAGEPTGVTEAPSSEPGAAAVRYGRRRRAPRYGSFLLTGAVVGLVIGVILSFSRPSTGQFSQNSVVGYVAATLGLVGALVGAAVAVLLDRRTQGPRTGERGGR